MKNYTATMAFEFFGTGIDGVKVIIPKSFKDQRGVFFEAYKKSEFIANGIKLDFQQQNISVSAKNVLRGLHYQLKPSAQGKLVSVMSGRIFDVAVDIRKGSSTFGKYVHVELDAQEKKMIWIPEGFAHGFLSMEENTKVSYLTTSEYSPQYERGIIWNDPQIGVRWPVADVIVSQKDSGFPKLDEAEMNFTFGGDK